MINFTSKDRYDFADLQRLVEVLRAPGGCPWDGAQTHLSIRRNFLEEAYEACEGFDLDDPAHMREELGDVLLQVLFHTDIEREAGRFTLDDVCDAECRKLIFRHPALFGGEAKSWDEVKQQEKGQTTVTETLDGVARSLPAAWRSEKIQKKAAKCGFAWESAAECLGKLEEETAELRHAIEEGVDPSEELGDMLFAAVNVAAFLQKDPEQVLHDACEKFIRRFGAMESAARQAGRSLDSLSREELLSLPKPEPNTEKRTYIMNKTELIAEVAKKCAMSKKDAEKAVSATFDTIAEVLCAGDKVQLVGFGGFETKAREARMGRNPKTKEPIEIPATTVPVFKPGKALKDQISK